ncbi:hypothetical protein NRD63_004071 [Salmonella enterica]|nr:hypothetical protein [Salmonella enterica]
MRITRKERAVKFIMILLPVLLTGCAARPVPPGGGGSLLSGVETQVAAVTRQAMDGDPGAVCPLAGGYRQHGAGPGGAAAPG